MFDLLELQTDDPLYEPTKQRLELLFNIFELFENLLPPLETSSHFTPNLKSSHLLVVKCTTILAYVEKTIDAGAFISYDDNKNGGTKKSKFLLHYNLS